MKDVILLSEIHPYGGRFFNPLNQASDWFNLLTQRDIADLNQQKGINFTKAIELIEMRSRERGASLVLRDWAHLDYTGLPFIPSPAYQPLLYTILAEKFDIIRVSTARDPVTQWQSLAQEKVMSQPILSGKFNLDLFLKGYRKYAELCVKTGFIRYEDFLQNPDQEMRKLCGQLNITFDPGFINKWYSHTKITGDIVYSRTSNKIEMTPKKPFPPDLKEAFLANDDYHRACELLGYATLSP